MIKDHAVLSWSFIIVVKIIHVFDILIFRESVKKKRTSKNKKIELRKKKKSLFDQKKEFVKAYLDDYVPKKYMKSGRFERKKKKGLEENSVPQIPVTGEFNNVQALLLKRQSHWEMAPFRYCSQSSHLWISKESVVRGGQLEQIVPSLVLICYWTINKFLVGFSFCMSL